MKELEESLRSIRNEVEYFTNRYNELPGGEYKDQIHVILLLAKAGEQAIIDKISKNDHKRERKEVDKP